VETKATDFFAIIGNVLYCGDDEKDGFFVIFEVNGAEL
jgi:hypothetical protein